jgi:hypothetical protein
MAKGLLATLHARCGETKLAMAKIDEAIATADRLDERLWSHGRLPPRARSP